jgi:hypothetical protein
MAHPSMRKELLPPLACVLAAAGAALLLRRGIVMGPDSWAYWEASVSLSERGSYTYFGGQPVTAFPPLFAVWLAAVQAVLGVSARALIASQVVLAGAAAWQWTRFSLETAGRPRAGVADALSALAVAAALAVSAQTLLSEALWLVLVPLALRAAGHAGARGALGLGLSAAGLLLCRNVTVAFVPALAAYAVLRAEPPVRARRAAVVAAALAGAVALWLAVRRSLGQSAAHALGSGSGGFLTYLGQTVAGLAEAFGPARLGIGAALLASVAVVWCAACLRRDALGVRLRALAAFVGLALLGQAALFATTYVAEPVRGRFLAFAAASSAIAVLASARWDGGAMGRAALAVGGALVAVALLRVGVKARLAGVEQPAVAWRTTLSSSYWSGPERPRGALVLVAPPTYPWLTRPVDGGATAP